MKRLFRNRPGIQIGAQTAGAQGFGARYHLAWSYQAPPLNGAQHWAWETFDLPRDTAIGAATANVRQSYNVTEPGVLYAREGIVIGGLADPGSAAGQYALQPLLDSNVAAGMGLAAPANGYPNYNLPTGGA